MTTESLQKLIHGAPFRPFTLHLADGRTIRVGHPDFVAHKPGGRIAVVLDDDGGFEFVDLLLVVSAKVEGVEPANRQG